MSIFYIREHIAYLVSTDPKCVISAVTTHPTGIKLYVEINLWLRTSVQAYTSFICTDFKYPSTYN